MTKTIDELEQENAELRQALQAAKAALEANSLDAIRWRALIGCARIRALGSAGIVQPISDGYAHVGLELWTIHDYREQNATGIEWLTKFADIAASVQQGECKS